MVIIFNTRKMSIFRLPIIFWVGFSSEPTGKNRHKGLCHTLPPECKGHHSKKGHVGALINTDVAPSMMPIHLPSSYSPHPESQPSPALLYLSSFTWEPLNTILSGLGCFFTYDCTALFCLWSRPLFNLWLPSTILYDLGYFFTYDHRALFYLV